MSRGEETDDPIMGDERAESGEGEPVIFSKPEPEPETGEGTRAEEATGTDAGTEAEAEEGTRAETGAGSDRVGETPEPGPRFSVVISGDGSASVDGEPVPVAEGMTVDAAILDMLHGYARDRDTTVTASISDPAAGYVAYVEVAADGSSTLLDQQEAPPEPPAPEAPLPGPPPMDGTMQQLPPLPPQFEPAEPPPVFALPPLRVEDMVGPHTPTEPGPPIPTDPYGHATDAGPFGTDGEADDYADEEDDGADAGEYIAAGEYADPAEYADADRYVAPDAAAAAAAAAVAVADVEPDDGYDIENDDEADDQVDSDGFATDGYDSDGFDGDSDGYDDEHDDQHEHQHAENGLGDESHRDGAYGGGDDFEIEYTPEDLRQPGGFPLPLPSVPEFGAGSGPVPPPVDAEAVAAASASVPYSRPGLSAVRPKGSRQSDDAYASPGLLHKPLVVGPVALGVAALVIVPLVILGSGGSGDGGRQTQAARSTDESSKTHAAKSPSPSPTLTTESPSPSASPSKSAKSKKPKKSKKSTAPQSAPGGAVVTVTAKPPRATVTARPPQDTAATAVNRLAKNDPNGRHICYRAYVSGQGWQKPVCDGTIAGTTGQGHAIKALNIAVAGVGGSAANAFIHDPHSTSGNGKWEPAWSAVIANGKNNYVGSTKSGAPNMSGFAINVGSGRICQTAKIGGWNWGGQGCADQRPGYIFGGTLDNSRYLEAFTFTV